MSKKNIRVFVVGSGDIGTSIATQLSKDGCEVTVIDRESEVLDNLVNSVDAIGYKGNGASYNTLCELNAKDADVLISVTDSDEINILSCFTAHSIGTKHTIARIRDVDYADQNSFYKKKLGISMIINPDLASANEIFRTLRFPLATRIEVFAGGRAELVELVVKEDSPLIGHSLIELNRMGFMLLVCAMVHENEAFVPKGDTVVSEGDVLYITGDAGVFKQSFKNLKMPIKPLKSVMLAGNDRITYYLAQLLSKHGVKVTIVDYEKTVCDRFASTLPQAAVMCEDSLKYLDQMTDSDIANTDAFVAITNNDEYNLIAAMYAKSKGINKIITKIRAKSRTKVLPSETDISIISREDVAADRILGYTRALINAEDNDAVESLYRLMDGKLEFIEFNVLENTKNLNIPLKELTFKRNVLIAGIIRNSHMIIPRGDDVISAQDVVLVVAIGHQIASIEDIYE